jgi:hypothetical protein
MEIHAMNRATLLSQTTISEANLMAYLPWFAWIAIVAILSSTVTNIINAMIKHRERLAMIQMGMHPDYPPDGRVVDQKPEAVGLGEL